MKKYLLFDLDGTLTDPKVGITTSVQYALRSFGIEEPDLDKLEPFIGPPLTDSFMQFYQMDEEQAKQGVEKYREYFKDKGIFENQVYPGIPKMLKECKQKKMRLAIASSKPTVFVERILEHFHLRQYFDVVVGSELDGTRVEKPDVVREALNQLFQGKPIDKEQIYMIGDRKFDVEGAQFFGIESVGVTYGYGGLEELMEAHADYIVQSVKELRHFLMRGYEDINPGYSDMGKIWAVFSQLLLFLLSRKVAEGVLGNIFFYLSGILPQSIYRLDDAGQVIGFQGNASAIISAFGFIAAALVVSKTAAFLIRKTGEDMFLTHLFKEPPVSYALCGGMALGFSMGITLLMNLTKLIESSDTYQQVAQNQFAADIVVGLLCYGVITPIAEELLFRGILYNYLRNFYGFKLAIIASAVLFEMYHMNSVQGVYSLAMGLIMAYSYEYFAQFRVPVFIHMGANILAYILSFAGFSFLLNWPVCLFFLALGIVCLWQMDKSKKLW